MFLDAEKAFNNLSWNFLKIVLLDCGYKFLSWMQGIFELDAGNLHNAKGKHIN